MAKNKKLDPALAETVERVLEDLMTRFEAAEEQLESRTDLPEISAETEANLLREIEADLDQFYPRATQQAAERAKPIGEAVDQMVTWLRVSGSEMLDRIAELVLPSMPAAAVARSRSAVLNELEAKDGVDEATLRELQFVPIRLDRDEPDTNILVLRYFGKGPVPATQPELTVRVDGEVVACEIESNLPSSPPEIEIIWTGDRVRLNQVGRDAEGCVTIDLVSI
ncbi:hypothetical protein KBY31_21700 [Ruegeria pomeroyi]|nr:hypothetical protein [Ruegeria pomeroyi]